MAIHQLCASTPSITAEKLNTCQADRWEGNWARGWDGKGWEKGCQESSLTPLPRVLQFALSYTMPRHSYRSITQCSPGKAPPASQQRQSPVTKGELRLALQGAPAREREGGGLGANLELGFPKPFQRWRLLAGSIAAAASLSGSTMSFPWQGQRWGKNNTQETRDM